MFRRLIEALRSHAYAFDFVLFPLLAVALIAIDCRSLAWVAWAGFGLVLFTFAEYWVHRTALHGLFFHSQHERHHTHPAEYVTFPFWFTPTLFAGFYLLMPVPIFVGFVVGYVWFLVWHDVLHHVDLTRWPRFVQRYALWHLRHHREDDCNYGITTNLWDVVFRTYRA